MMFTSNSPAGDLPDDEVGATTSSGPDVSDLRYPAAPADPQQLIFLRGEITRWATRTGLHPARVSDLQLAVYEAMTNVVVHAYPGRTGTLALHARSRGESVIVTVADYGEWQPAARPGFLHGRGLPLIRALSDHSAVDIGTTGTTVTMTWIKGAESGYP